MKKINTDKRNHIPSIKKNEENNQTEIYEYIDFIKRYKILKINNDKYNDKIITKLDILYAFFELIMIGFSISFFLCLVTINISTILIIFNLIIITPIILVLIAIKPSERTQIKKLLFENISNVYFKLLFVENIKKNRNNKNVFINELLKEENSKIEYLIKDSSLNNYLKGKRWNYNIEKSSDFDDFEDFYNKNILSKKTLRIYNEK